MSDPANAAGQPGAVATSVSAPPAERPGRNPGRRRPPPKRVEVVSVSELAPWLVSVRVAGEGLSGFDAAAPTSHIKIFLPVVGQDAPFLPDLGADGLVWPEGVQRPVVRTYTPRRYDPRDGALEVQFVLHGSGPAATWAQRVRVGDQIGIAGPGGRFSLDPADRRWWIAGDESALPAIGTLLDALPASATAEVHVEVAGALDQIPLDSRAETTVIWHPRRDQDAWGDELYRAALGADIDKDTRVWVAGEAVAVRRIRKHFINERQVRLDALVTRGYWRLGEAGHPDHDYGEDE
jgi:NADPH-dependent ferric siderophore reductase